MKKIYIMLILSIVIVFGCFKNFNHSDIDEFSVYSTSSISNTTLNDMVLKMQDSDVIFFGERHDDSFTHALELSVFKKLCSKYKNVALGMEMFEKDVQNIVDSFLNGEIPENDFIVKSRAWNNYRTDYAPLVVYAKRNGIRVFAANIPRSLASIVAKNGEDSLFSVDSFKSFFNKPVLKKDDYKKLFIDFMASMMPSGNSMSHMTNMDNLFMSQLYKDATMAHSINNIIKDNRTEKVFFLCGEFHSNYRLGTVEQLSIIDTALTITTIAVEDSMETADFYKADYLIIKGKR